MTNAMTPTYLGFCACPVKMGATSAIPLFWSDIYNSAPNLMLRDRDDCYNNQRTIDPFMKLAL